MVVESTSLVYILFREAFSHPNISFFFHLLVNVVCVTGFHTLLMTSSLPYIGEQCRVVSVSGVGWYRWVVSMGSIGGRGGNLNGSYSTPSAMEPARTSF